MSVTDGLGAGRQSDLRGKKERHFFYKQTLVDVVTVLQN